MKIQISIALIVLVLTVIFRKYFYMSLNHIKSEEINDFEEVNNDTLKTDKLEKEIKKEDWLNFDIKNTSEKKEDYTFKMDEDETKEEDDIKIFMDKEIKR
jgi:hypothetical protein